MDYVEFARGIKFRFLQPEEPLGTPNALKLREASGNLPADFVNTKLPAEEEQIRLPLLELSSFPRMSTLANGAIINRIVSEMPPDVSFVNVGTWFGFTLLSGMANNPEKYCIGVDNFSQFTELSP